MLIDTLKVQCGFPVAPVLHVSRTKRVSKAEGRRLILVRFRSVEEKNGNVSQVEKRIVITEVPISAKEESHMVNDVQKEIIVVSII